MRLTLKYVHNGEAKMVGKIFETSNIGNEIFYHKSTESQWHRDLDSPGGIDSDVLDWLIAAGIRMIHHHVPTGKHAGLYITYTLALKYNGIKQVSDGRERVYLPAKFWANGKKPWYKIPYIPTEKIIGESIDLGEPSAEI